MAVAFATPNTLLGALQPEGRTARLATSLALAVLGTVLLTISAKINIPFIPVPATFQTAAVAFIAAAFGARLGAATVVLYLIEGLAGLPVFAAGGGAAYLMGPTGGFLVGFVPMAYIIGTFADRGASRAVLPLFGAMLIGDAVLFGFGFAWLLVLAGSVTWIDQSNVLVSAFNIAIKPFIVWDLLKMAFAALTVAGGWQLAKSLGKA